MKNFIEKILNIVSWFFVAFCLLMAIGVGFGAGCIMLILTAVVAMPLKPIRDLWDKILGIHEIAAVDETKAQFWQMGKKKAQRNYRKAKEDQKSRKVLKPLLIAFAFIMSFCIGAAGMDTPEAPDLSNPVSMENVIEETTTTNTEIQETIQIEATTAPETLPTEIVKTANAVVPTEAPAETSVPDLLSENSTFSIHYIDVGQADSALVECDGHYMLIDGGNKADSSIIYTVLKNASVSKLDIVVGTHAHEDHIGGLPGAFNYATADITLCPVTNYDSNAFEDFKKYADLNGGGITVPSVGDSYKLGSATVDILGVNGDTDTNNTSIVLKITYGNTSFLFTGDAEREAEQAILNRGADLSATVLKVGHHGSDTSTTYPFLREIMPQYAIISVGEGNSYGHPTDNNLSRLRDADVEIYRTDLNGDVFLTSDGDTVAITAKKTATREELLTAGGNSQASTPTQTAPTQAAETEAPPVGTDYVVNTNTGKFHYPSCSSVKKMKESNKMYFTGTRDELTSQGYSPCGNCHP